MYLPWKKMMFCRVEKTAFGECLCVHIFSKDKVSFRILQMLSGLNAVFFLFPFFSVFLFLVSVHIPLSLICFLPFLFLFLYVYN